MFFDYACVYQISAKTYRTRNCERGKSVSEFIASESVSSDGRHYYGRCTRGGRKEKISGYAHIGDAHSVGYQILGRSGNEEENKREQISPFGIVYDR